MVLFLRMLWYKWIKRGCPHVCVRCAYRPQCLNDLFNELQIRRDRKI